MVPRNSGELGAVRVVVSEGTKTAEIVAPEEVSLDAIPSPVWRLAELGWDITVLVTLHRMGEAHRALRGSPCRLQPWWVDGSEVAFGRHEVP